LILSRPRRAFGAAVTLADASSTELWASNTMEARPFKDASYELYRLLQDTGTQAVPELKDAAVQVRCPLPHPNTCRIGRYAAALQLCCSRGLNYPASEHCQIEFLCPNSSSSSSSSIYITTARRCGKQLRGWRCSRSPSACWCQFCARYVYALAAGYWWEAKTWIHTNSAAAAATGAVG
jgi:hypothetical protein